MDIKALVDKMVAANDLNRAVNLPGLTLGLPARRYLGQTLLPVRIVPKNMFRDTSISYRTVMANNGTRYSPVVIEKGVAVGSMAMELGELDIGSTYTADEYDALVELLGQAGDMAAQAEILNWAVKTLGLPVQERLEQQRWQALDDAQVVRIGANGYDETVEYPNPVGHRVVGPSLSDADADPIEALIAMKELAAGKGYRLSRAITSTKYAGLIARHPLVRAAIGGEGSTVPVRVTRERVNEYLQENDLPAVEVYDLTGRERNGTVTRFKRENAFTLVAETGRTAQVDLPDEVQNLSNTVGYAAVGRAAGQPTSGIVTKVEYQDKKPVGLYGETYATGGVVVTDPESIFVVNFQP